MTQSTSAKKLGKLISTHQAQPLRWRDLLTTFLPLGLVVLSPLGYGVWRTYYGYTHYGVAAAERWGRPWFLLSAILALPLLFYALHRLRRAHWWATLHTHGIRVQRPPGRVQSIRWEEVEGVGTSITRKRFLWWDARTRHRVSIFAVNQPPIRLDDRIPHLPELIDTLKANVYPLLRPQLHQSYAAGKSLYFGVLEISKPALHYQGKKYFWRDIDSLQVHKGYLLIHFLHKKPLRIPVDRILNIELLTELLEYDRKKHSKA